MDKKVTVSLLVAVITFGLAGCTTTQYYDGHYHDDFVYHEHPFHHHDYYYYPNIAVYFHIHSGYYYYRHNGHWLRSHKLPKKIYLDQRSRRHLVVKDKEPFIHHHEHKLKFKNIKKFHDSKKYDKPEREHHRKIHEKHKKWRERDRGDKRSPR